MSYTLSPGGAICGRSTAGPSVPRVLSQMSSSLTGFVPVASLIDTSSTTISDSWPGARIQLMTDVSYSNIVLFEMAMPWWL
jgi:hypothetical protein